MTKRLGLEELFGKIVDLVLGKFLDIVVDVKLRLTTSGAVERLRVFLKDGSFVDVWLSASGKYSYHWEHRHVRGLIHRHDNAPHNRWKGVKTFPRHFHDGDEADVKESVIPDDPVLAIRYFLNFVRDFLNKN